MKKIIIDTDPGVDDALAILLAITSKLNIIGITTTFGNSTIENTTRNALTILEILQSSIPVYMGSSNPLIKTPIVAKSHGKNGLGGFSIKNIKNIKKKISAIQFIINTLEENVTKEVDILCLGPTTNLALLKILRPDLICKINQIIILGGVFFEKGNITPTAEFNVYNDPKALDILLSFNVPTTLIPINVCRKVVFNINDFNQIKNTNISKSFKQISKIYIDYYKNDPKYGKFKGGVMYDLLVISFLINSNSFKTENKYISVKSNGQTKIKNDIASNCNLVVGVNPKKVKQLFFSTINSNLNTQSIIKC